MEQARFEELSLGEAAVVAVRGEVDLSNADQFKAALLRAVATGKRLTVDLTGCRYFDSSGLAALLAARKLFGQHLPVVTQKGSFLRHLFHIAGVEKLFVLFDEVEGAGASAEQC